MTWGKIILGAWGLLLAYSTALSSLPASWWFEVSGIHVENAAAGECPKMTVNRDINRHFYAKWTVTVMRQTAGGNWYTYSTHRGANDYRPDNSLPDNLDLCWWAWVDQIDLLPGRYRIHTLWRIEPANGGMREVRRASNAFDIYPQR
ncbi:hypothetical protein [Leisingera sp. ANG-M7]|uniref:hypothetical protein n=1 Tax=Leisingera sp. ANG-M7 TaxID=1577902 RepID=UPI00057D459F|nr:hypothetical protein [Leisingera sp. ANG-M7]KIC39352.1 hypothetical protein RA26_01480 [Leisingera sp. ANG-M7]